MARLMAPLSASAAVLSLLCRPFLLAAEEHLGDANAYTCLAPIMEGQAMEESFVWKALAQGFQDDELPTLTSAASDGAHGGTKGLRKQDQFVLKLLDSKVQAECASAKDWREPIRDAIEAAMSAAKGEHRRLKGFSLDPGHLKNLAKKGHAKSDWRHESIGGLVDKAVAKARAQEDAIEKALAPRKGSSASGAPVAHEGEECWVPCGNRSGNCSSGFCGGGVCCRRFHLHPECPLGLQGGCSDKYCCVARPQEAPAGAQKQPRCNAKPGSWCLASVAKSLDHRNLTSVERCALERTEYMCPPGFYCSGGRESPKACSRGQRCPLGSVEQQPCPAGVFCPISIWEEKCPYAHACPENSTHAVWCPEGSYCPDGVNLTCPAGYVCDRGSVAPQRCALLASCPEGSSSQGWGFLAKCSMAVVIPTWTIAMKTVPRWLHPQGGLSGAIPTLITIGVIVAAWVANLNLIYMTARQFDYSGGPSSAGRWRIERLFGAAPHSTALVFLTILYSLLVYGFFISFQMPSGTVRLALDTVMVILSCATFNVYLEDWHSAMFIFFLWAAFKVVWALITQTGPAELRVAALCAGLAALAGGFCLYDTPELAQLLALAVLAAGAKEVVCEAIPWSELYMRLRRVDPREKNPMTGGGGGGSASVELPVLGDRSRTSSGSADDSPGSSAAAAVIAAARASLDAHQSEQEAKKERTPSHGQSPARSSTWVPRYGGAGSSSDDDEDDDCYASGRGGKRQGGGISFELREVAYRLNNGRKLLQDITFSVPGGASVAIMGASGAGKTTLLSVLSGRCGDGRLLGELRINGARMLPWQMAALRPLIGYVPQDDVMHGCLTVRENVEFQAELRLRHAFRSHLPEEVSRLLRSRIDNTISGLGLAHVRERVVRDGLSGGQRKRVSIGMEIVSRPRVLLLDEPSSGLDSSTTHRLLEMVLHGASTELCTSFATIHQPRWKTLRLFDMLVLLAPGGYLIYAGPVASLKEYFRAVPSVDFPRDQNPADVIIDASTFDSARMMAVEGIWRNPPQCIRAVLIPTPEMEDEEAKETWQIEEFGKMLAALWRGFAAVQTEIGSAASAALGSSAAASGGEPGSSMEPPQRSGGGGAASGSGGGAGGDVELGDLGGSARPPARPTGEARELLRPNSPSARWLPWLRVMASRWAAREIRLRTAQASSSEEGLGLLTVEAGERAANIHWAQQVWVHLARGLLVTSRALWPTVACSVGLLVISVIAFGLAFPTMGFDHIFLRMGFLFLLMGLVTAVAAQRIFGDEEHAVAGREAAVCSLPQVVFSFIGKDIASLVDIGISAACFTLTYWPMIKSNTSCSDLFALSFSFMYGVYGMNYIGSILFDSNIAKLLAVITSFICFLNCGAKPAAHDIMKTTLGTLLLLASPQRWALAQLYYRHAVGQGSTHTQEHFLHNLGNFANHDFSIEALPQQCPDHTATVLERWRNQNSWACHSGQLLLLGLLYRFLAMMGLLLRSSAKASGGELSFGMSTGLRTRITRSLVVIFLVFFMLFQLLLLGHTY